MDTCTAACGTGTWDNANTCQACAAVANSATGSTLTCTSNTNSQLVGDCKTGYWKDTTNNDDRCTMHSTCTGTQLAIGNCAAVTRAMAVGGDGTLIADTTCVACTAGTYGNNNGVCTGCVAVAGAATDATYLCTTNGDSRVSACLATKKYTTGAVGAHDTCTDTCGATTYDMAGECTACTAVKWAAVGSVLGCSSATTSKFTAGTCADGYYEVSDTCTASADTCVACTAVANSKTDTALTCTSATNSQVVACADGYFKTDGVADVCTACTAVTNGVGLTCTSATDSQVTSCSADNLFQSSDNADSTADSCVAVCTACAFYAKDNVCTAETACAGHTDGTDGTARTQVTDTTNIADRTCTPCETGSWAAGNGDCVAHSTCGCQSDKLKRAAATAGDLTADTVCDACTNAFGLNTGDCTACSPVAGAASDATLTCTKVGDTRVSACAACDTTVKTVGGASTDDTCTETCGNGFYSATGMCKAHTVCDVARGTKSAGTPTTDAVCKPCAGKFGENSATCAAQTACTAVVGAVADATYTCTSATDSRVSACAAATSIKTVGATGAADTCAAAPAATTAAATTAAPAGGGVAAGNTATIGCICCLGCF